MPVKTKKIGGKFRIVGPDGKIEMTPNGKPRDGGGHATEEQAMAQMRAINANIRTKEGNAF